MEGFDIKVGIYDLTLKEKELINKMFHEVFGDKIKYDLHLYSLNQEKEIKDYDVLGFFVHSKVDEKSLENFPKAKHLIAMSTGFNNVDLEFCKRKGITVYNIPDYGTQTVAEFTLLLILAVLRKFNLILEDMKCALCIEPEHLKGRELNGKTIGVVGTGRIGSALIKLLRGFDVEILAYNRSIKDELVKMGVKYVPLEELLKKSDIISLHLPLTEETRHIINEERLSLLKKGAVLINTARGELIDTKALVKRVDVLYLGLDVVEGEKTALNEIDVVKNFTSKEEFMNAFFIDFLVKHPNAIITPHIAYNTEEGELRRLKKTVLTIKNIVEAKESKNRIV